MSRRFSHSPAWAATCLMLALIAPVPAAANDLVGPVPAVAPAEAEAAWRFRVYLDDKEIGYHDFFLDERGPDTDGEVRHLRSVAKFEYRVLGLRLYHYDHENLETWSDGCLQSIESRTDANGRPYAVAGRAEPAPAGGFRVRGSAGEETLPGCVMSFAYWNPAFLQQKRLLNTQTGKFHEVEVSPPVRETLLLRGEPREAWRYRVSAEGLRLDLWYSAEREWLALESEVKSGRTLRYELN
jgi:hypothetical protein